MADLAGLRRVERWADWDGRQPANGDALQVSVYRKARYPFRGTGAGKPRPRSRMR